MRSSRSDGDDGARPGSWKRWRCQALPWIFVLTTGLPALDASGPPVPEGPDFQVNSYTTSTQWRGAVSPLSNGGFVVVWESYGSYGTDDFFSSIQGQRYDAEGAAVGSEFQVNSYTSSNEATPVVGSLGAEGFVVTWRGGGEGLPLDPSNIKAQLYDPSGSPVGEEFLVNSSTPGQQAYPAVHVGESGGFVIVWSHDSAGGSDPGESIRAQRFESNGLPSGDDFQVNSYTTDSQIFPAIGADGSGGFVVVWESVGSSGNDSSSTSIQGQRFGADWLPSGGEFQINSYTSSGQFDPAISPDGSGGFVVVWTSAGSDGDDYMSVQGQRFASDGSAVAGEFQVNSYTTGRQDRPAVSPDGSGGFIVVWQGNGVGGDDIDGGIHGQVFGSDGSRVGGEFQVNSYTPFDQRRPAMSQDGSGRLTVVWNGSSNGSDNEFSSIQSRRHAAPLFCDGFESGDTSAWSVTVP